MKKATGEFRIIAGQWRGRKLPIVESQGLRPTTDRVRETVFNWLQFDIVDAVVVDLFAGSGSLGFEAASRGASKVTLVERDQKVAEQLKTNIGLLRTAAISVLQQDAIECLSNNQLPSSADVVFVDPPFQQGLAEQALTRLADSSVVDEYTLVYLEVEKGLTLDLSRWRVIKDKHHGNVSFRLLQLNE